MKLGPQLLVKLERLNVHRCEKCPQIFSNTSDLIKHKSFHEEYFLSHLVSAYVLVKRANIFKCDKCTQSFDNNRQFMLHKLEHIQETVRNERKDKSQNPNIVKPYKCPDCDVSYVAKSTLDAHSVLHLPFPHTCDCGIGYYRKQDLNLHIKLVHQNKFIEEDILPQNEEKVIPQKKPQVKSPSKPKSKKGTKASAVKKVKPKKKWKVNLKSEDTNSNSDVDFRKTSDNKLECPECKKLFSCKAHANVHYRVHSGKRPYSCHLCPKAFTQSGTLKLHVQRHTTTEKIYACKYCPKLFTFPEYRDRHEHIHSAIKAHECPYCGKAFHDPSALTRHKRTHTGYKPYHCPYCPKTFSDASGLHSHKLRHENKKRFQCEICFKRFYDRASLKIHMRVHTLERTVACDYCKKLFSCKGNLAVHIRFTHMLVKKQFECDQCNEKFMRKDNLILHIRRIHTKNKVRRSRKECNVCFKRFYRHDTLMLHHEKNHSGIRCDECSRCFETPAHFKNHKLIETVKCEICDVKFNCANMKEKHFKVHYSTNVTEIKRDSDCLNEI